MLTQDVREKPFTQVISYVRYDVQRLIVRRGRLDARKTRNHDVRRRRSHVNC